MTTTRLKQATDTAVRHCSLLAFGRSWVVYLDLSIRRPHWSSATSRITEFSHFYADYWLTHTHYIWSTFPRTPTTLVSIDSTAVGGWVTVPHLMSLSEICLSFVNVKDSMRFRIKIKYYILDRIPHPGIPASEQVGPTVLYQWPPHSLCDPWVHLQTFRGQSANDRRSLVNFKR